jgi:hypothetical protein
MHDYALPAHQNHVSELRPGLLGVPTPPKGSTPAPSSSFTRGHSKSARSFSSATSPGLSDPWMSSPSTSLSSAFARSFAALDMDVESANAGVGQGSSWTLPSSDMRSSARAGDEERGFEAVKEEDEDDEMSLGRRADVEEDEWAGDMDMD